MFQCKCKRSESSEAASVHARGGERCRAEAAGQQSPRCAHRATGGPGRVRPPRAGPPHRAGVVAYLGPREKSAVSDTPTTAHLPTVRHEELVTDENANSFPEIRPTLIAEWHHAVLDRKLPSRLDFAIQACKRAWRSLDSVLASCTSKAIVSARVKSNRFLQACWNSD